MNTYRPKLERRVLSQVSRAALLLVLALLQTTLLPTVWLFRVNLVLVAVISWTLLSGALAGTRWASYGGVALGLLSPLPLGAHLLGLALAVLVVSVITEELPRDSGVVISGCVLLGSLVNGVVLALSMRLAGQPISWLRYPFTVLIPETLANLLITMPVFAALQRFRRTRRRG